MIPKIIHYCWFGRGEMPQLAKDCIASWHKYMPDWEYMLWNEENFDIKYNDYTREAYEAKKYAFVSDVARLVALNKYGGLYLDTDVEVLKSFNDLMNYKAFAGFEGSKNIPVGTCVLASEPQGEWVSEMLKAYRDRLFIGANGRIDVMTNVQFLTRIMAANGLKQNGDEQEYKDLHVFPVDYFCPRHTTGEYILTNNTYSDHKGIHSWGEEKGNWKARLLSVVGPMNRIRLIKFKRKIFG